MQVLKPAGGLRECDAHDNMDLKERVINFTLSLNFIYMHINIFYVCLLSINLIITPKPVCKPVSILYDFPGMSVALSLMSVHS